MPGSEVVAFETLLQATGGWGKEIAPSSWFRIVFGCRNNRIPAGFQAKIIRSLKIAAFLSECGGVWTIS
jgi:hypothetical protein